MKSPEEQRQHDGSEGHSASVCSFWIEGSPLTLTLFLFNGVAETDENGAFVLMLYKLVRMNYFSSADLNSKRQHKKVSALCQFYWAQKQNHWDIAKHRKTNPQGEGSQRWRPSGKDKTTLFLWLGWVSFLPQNWLIGVNAENWVILGALNIYVKIPFISL